MESDVQKELDALRNFAVEARRRLDKLEKVAEHCDTEEARRLDRKARALVQQFETGSQITKAFIWFLTTLGAIAFAMKELGLWAWLTR